MWVAPDSPVRFVAVAPGDRLSVGGYDVRVLAAGHGDDAVLYDVRPAGPGALRHRHRAAARRDARGGGGAAFDVVLMEETFGDKADHGTEHLDLAAFAEQVRRLREVGAVPVAPTWSPCTCPTTTRRPRAEPAARRRGAHGSSTTARCSARAAPPGATRVDRRFPRVAPSMRPS